VSGNKNEDQILDDEELQRINTELEKEYVFALKKVTKCSLYFVIDDMSESSTRIDYQYLNQNFQNYIEF